MAHVWSKEYRMKKIEGIVWLCAGIICGSIGIFLLAAVVATLRSATPGRGPGWAIFGFFGIAIAPSIVMAAIFVLASVLLIRFSRDVWRREPQVMLSRVYRGMVGADIAVGADPEFLAQTMGCSRCNYLDKAATPETQPWCRAPSPPQIDRLRCMSFK